MDVRGCGIGNLVLLVAGYIRHARTVPPYLVHDTPEELAILNLKTVKDPVECAESGLSYMSTTDACSAFCNLRELFHPELPAIMHSIVQPPLPLPRHGADAGFCFRVTKPHLDRGYTFMSDKAIAAMMDAMHAFEKPFVCCNDAALLKKLLASHPGAIAMPSRGTEDVRNAPDHIHQWFALAECPIVFHGIGGGGGSGGGGEHGGSGEHGAIASTFAPTAAVYGGCRAIVGVDNDGVMYGGSTYRW